MTTVQTVTRAYEEWLAGQIPVVEADLKAKHDLMATDEFTFFRATYYLWLVRVAEVLPDVLKASRTPIIGDLHAENFGTWRDVAGDLRWGVNDLDELAHGAWLLDPLRLATSAALSPHVALKTKDIATTVLDAYASADPAPSPTVSDRPHLAALMPKVKDAGDYFGRLSAGTQTHDVPPPVLHAAVATAPGSWAPQWHVRQAGAGSLGHRRVVGVGKADTALVAREAKQLDPGTAAWARTSDPSLPVPAPEIYADVVRALGRPAASVRVDGWQLRALAPDEVRIELRGLSTEDATVVLTAMASAAVTVHGVDRPALVAAQREAAALDRDTFHAYVKTMKQTIQRDFENSR